VNATRGAAAGEGAGGSTGERTADLLPLTFRPVVTRALLLCLGIALVAVLTTVVAARVAAVPVVSVGAVATVAA